MVAASVGAACRGEVCSSSRGSCAGCAASKGGFRCGGRLVGCSSGAGEGGLCGKVRLAHQPESARSLELASAQSSANLGASRGGRRRRRFWMDCPLNGDCGDGTPLRGRRRASWRRRRRGDGGRAMQRGYKLPHVELSPRSIASKSSSRASTSNRRESGTSQRQ